MGSSLLCYPVASFDGFRPHASYVLGLRSPPPPPPAPQPPPPEWLPPINAGDMLYSPAGDSALPSNHMPSIGNGRVATLLMADAIYAAGVFNGQGLEYGSHRARIPATHAVSAPGLPGPAALNVREATYYRRSTIVGGGTACTAASTVSCVNTVGGGNVTVEQRWYAHRALPSLLVMEVQVIADASAPPSGVEPYAMLLLANNAGLPSADFNFTSAPQPEGTPFTVTIGWTQGTECPPGACGAVVTSLFGAAVLSTAMPATSVVPVPVADAHATLAFFTVIRTSVETFPADDSLLVAAAAADYAAAAALAAAGTLHATHVAEWASTVWTSGFSIDRKDVALAVNTSLYSIVSSLRNDVFESTSPGGGSTDSYNGHSFWDCEARRGLTWMWPTINLLFPDIADAMLQYRVKHIPGAFYKATTFTPAYSGAMFPWESATSGTELASAPWGTREDHIGSDIAAAVWAFHLATQDVAGAWLTSTAWPLLQGIASFYMSKIAIDNPGAAADAPLSIRDVMGPDEYADHVTDSCYTNAGVIQTLTHAAAVAQLVGAEPSVYEPWLDAASRIVIVFDAARQYHPESANYSYGTRVKQADTILLGFPFEFAHPTMSAQTRANDLLAYANVSDSNGPAMTQGMFACGFIELGPTYAALAAHFFNLSFANAQPPFAVWTETPKGGATNFITGAGGFLQTAFNGYTQLRVNSSGMALSPALPEGASTVGLRGVSYLGNRLDISYDAATMTIALRAAPAAAAPLPAAARYADPCAASVAPTQCRAALRLTPAGATAIGAIPARRAERSQDGRVVLGDGHVIPPQALVVVDAAGVTHALAPGQAWQAHRQSVRIVAAAT